MTYRTTNVMDNDQTTTRRLTGQVRMSPIERAAIEYVARIEGVKFSEACRMLIRESLRDRGVYIGEINAIR